MSILTGPEIIRQRELGNIIVTPWDVANVGPNSIDVHLGNTLKVYRSRELHTDRPNETLDIRMGSEGFLLLPGNLYLASTVEHTETRGFVPMLAGRSSTGRLGISIHVTAGFGDDGFCGTWTLEITVAHPVVVKPGMRIGQLCYHTLEGERKPYKGRYLGQVEPTASRFHEPTVGAA